MKQTLAIAVLVAAIAALGVGQMSDEQGKKKAGGKGNVEQTLTQMEREWVEAAQKKDASTLDRILADDWVGQSPTGITTKSQALSDLKSGDSKLDTITLGEMKVRTFGDTAVVTGSDDEKSSYKGKDTGGHYVWTDVFVKRKGNWQAVASQNTLMAQQ